MTSYEEIIGLLVLAIILGVAARFLLAQLLHTTKASVRFGIAGGLFSLYTIGLILFLRQTYIHAQGVNASLQYYHQAVILTIVIANIIVLFAGILYFTMRGKHRLSPEDKMKLKDL